MKTEAFSTETDRALRKRDNTCQSKDLELDLLEDEMKEANDIHDNQRYSDNIKNLRTPGLGICRMILCDIYPDLVWF